MVYADDMSILTTNKQNLQRIVQIIELWEDLTAQKTNPDKTEILTNQPDPAYPIEYRTKPIKQTTQFKY